MKYDFSRPLRVHEGYMGNQYAHSRMYSDMIAPRGAEILDPRGLLRQSEVAMAPTQVSGAGLTMPARMAPRASAPSVPAVPAPPIVGGWGQSASPTAGTVVQRRRPIAQAAAL